MRTLLMGGQACVLYGAAEFSRDVDLLVLADSGSLELLQTALEALAAKRIAVPGFERSYLERGHAVHFRCQRDDVNGLRIDVMSRLRGVDHFESLWARRTTMVFGDDVVDLLSLADLVRAKKTQRDKDWPMIRRLVEQVYFNRSRRDIEAVQFLFLELRTPELLMALTGEFADTAHQLASQRLAIERSISGTEEEVAAALNSEESAERALDRAYWRPLRSELETLRRARANSTNELD